MKKILLPALAVALVSAFSRAARADSYMWFTSQWPGCGPKACATGEEHRSVSCRDLQTRTEADNSFCDQSSKPDTTQPCPQEECGGKASNPAPEPPPTAAPPPPLHTAPPPPAPAGACDENQLSSSLNGVRLRRQCSGTVGFNGYAPAYSGSLTRLDVVLATKYKPGPFPNLTGGHAISIPITAGNYVSLGFTVPPTSTNAQMQFVSNESVGDAGIISISMRPGAFTLADGVIVDRYGIPCVSDGGGAAIWSGIGVGCQLTAGQTYYVNFADVDDNGSQGPVARVGYSEYFGGN